MLPRSASDSRSERPLEGMRVAACLHVTAETANLMRTLQAGGAESCCAPPTRSPPRTTWRRRWWTDYGIRRLRHQGRGQRDLLPAHHAALDSTVRNLTMDDGADVSAILTASARAARRRDRRHRGDHHRRHPPAGAWQADGVLEFPIIAVNDGHTKHMFDNRYGTGQSTLDGIIRATNILLAGQHVRGRRLRLVRPRRWPSARADWARR